MRFPMLLALALVACGKQRTPPPPPIPAASTAPVALAPISALPTPSDLSLHAETPFALRIGWAANPGAMGFEIQRKKNGDWVRAAAVDGTKRVFEHHHLLPGDAVQYRLRAFSAEGTSDWATASTTMPTEQDGPSLPVSKCITLPTKAPPSGGCDPEISILQAPGGEPVSNVPGADFGCRRHFIAKYKGCPRELAVFDIQADVRAVEGHADEGYPLIDAIMGAGLYTGVQIATLQFRRGHYVIADMAQFCGEPSEDSPGIVAKEITESKPPFEDCQRDLRD